MQTLPRGNGNLKAFNAHLYEESGVLSKVNGELVFFSDAGDITTVEPSMINFLVVLGEVGLTETSRLLEAAGPAWIATHRAQEVS
jgi:hypothetical protein